VKTLYSATLFDVFAANFALAAMMLIVGGLCAAYIFVRRPGWERHLSGWRDARKTASGRAARIAATLLMVCAQAFGLFALYDAGRELISGPQVLTSPLRARYERQCGPRLTRCYYLEFNAKSDTYLRVPSFAYDQMREGLCYRVTYFRSQLDLYPGGYVAEIVQMPPGGCG